MSASRQTHPPCALLGWTEWHPRRKFWSRLQSWYVCLGSRHQGYHKHVHHLANLRHHVLFGLVLAEFTVRTFKKHQRVFYLSFHTAPASICVSMLCPNKKTEGLIGALELDQARLEEICSDPGAIAPLGCL